MPENSKVYADTPTIYGQLLRSTRQRLNLTQYELAAKLNCSQASISLIECGRGDQRMRGSQPYLFESIDRMLSSSLSDTSKKPEYKIWREMATAEMQRLFANENLRYNVYSQWILTPEMRANGCTLDDVNAIIADMVSEGVVKAVATSVFTAEMKTLHCYFVLSISENGEVE